MGGQDVAGPARFRADHVGSLLRPERLLEARRGRDTGTITASELRAAEDEAIAAAVRRQRESGIDVVTDGEFRRRDFRTGFVDAVDGISMRTFDMPWRTSEGIAKLASKQFVVTGRITQRRRLAAGESAYLRTMTTAPVKVTLIAPGFLVDRHRCRRGRRGAAPAGSVDRHACLSRQPVQHVAQ
jgi:5-methyltetrahydropteroyltriglutamate--homocysteine methyltransferase